MLEVEMQETSLDVWKQKYQLKDHQGNTLEPTILDTYKRVARALANVETSDQDLWYDKFLWALENGAIPAGRILSNAGAEKYKPATSLINCTVSRIVPDSMRGILESNLEAGITLAAGCGIGYEFSTLRPRGAYVHGAGANTSGSVSFMDIFDKMCFTVSSAGGRRGAQMATLAVWHPDVEEFITAKRENGRLRQFNLSVLMDDEFMAALENDGDHNLVFPVKQKELELGVTKDSQCTWKPLFWEEGYCKEQDYVIRDGFIFCKVYKTIKAKSLWDQIMKLTYDFAEPGVLFVDRMNSWNPLNWIEKIRASNPCGEQPLPPYGSCLLGSVNLTKMLNFDKAARKFSFDIGKYETVVRLFSRMLDNVVEINGLPLPKQREEIYNKRRHGMGITGLGSTLALLGEAYGSEGAISFVSTIMRIMATASLEEGVYLAMMKGCAPVLNSEQDRLNYLNTRFIKSLLMTMEEDKREFVRREVLRYGVRYSHATSIAPTGTMSLSVCNNVSNGIEPSFSHKYTRNVIKEGEKAKRAVDVLSFELLAWQTYMGDTPLPASFITADEVSPEGHIAMQAAAQPWVDSAISKTCNVPTTMSFDKFKGLYGDAYKAGLKGFTTFRFNPEAFQGVLVKEDDLASTTYTFTTEDGQTVSAKGNDLVEYEGGSFSAANLFDALKEGYYGKF